MSDNALVYIHGKGGTASAAEAFKPLFPEYEIFGFDYKAENPWEAEPEFREYITALDKEYGPLTVIASSLGAYNRHEICRDGIACEKPREPILK